MSDFLLSDEEIADVISSPNRGRLYFPFDLTNEDRAIARAQARKLAGWLEKQPSCSDPVREMHTFNIRFEDWENLKKEIEDG